MMLSIDERDLKAKLNEHNSLIGVGSIGDGIANLIAGIFYILTACFIFSRHGRPTV